MFLGIQVSVGQKECPVTWYEVCKTCLPEVGVNNHIFHLLDDIHERCLLFSNLASHWPIYSLSLWDGPTHPAVCNVCFAQLWVVPLSPFCAYASVRHRCAKQAHFFSILRVLFLLPALLLIIFASVYFTTVESLPTEQFDSNSFFLAWLRWEGPIGS